MADMPKLDCSGHGGGKDYGNGGQDSMKTAEAVVASLCGSQGGAFREGTAPHADTKDSGPPPNSGGWK